jgi:4-amino-4-deoxy-L-arabinose transferase-like glycosyltransferase
MTSIRLQELIHKFEVGVGARVIGWVATAAIFVGIALLYDVLCYRNFSTAQAMDSAQLARNVAGGKGFTTDYVRPLSMFLIARHRADKSPMLKEGHPDLANPPLYPLLLAPVLKFLPEQDMTSLRNFTVARGDFAVAVVNQALLLLSLLLLFRLARRWFDPAVATVSAIVFGLTELYWRFSVSGLSTNLAIFLLLALALAAAKMEESCREDFPMRKTYFMAVLCGLLLGALALTKYSAAWLLVPVLLFTTMFFGPRRLPVGIVIILCFTTVVAPWVARNVTISGAPFGTAGYAIMEQTRLFPEDQLLRSLHPDVEAMPVGEYVRKLIVNGRDVIASDLPRLAGNWTPGLFLASLIISFRNVGLRRGRWLVVLMLGTLIPVQALCRTQQSVESPEINVDNLLVLISPLVITFGVSAFFVLTESLVTGAVRVRYAISAVFIFVMALPLSLALLPPRPNPVVYPPYFPPFIQTLGGWLDRGSLVMSDVPAAVAWYGKRQSIMLTPTWREEFAEIHDFQKPINTLYLTAKTTGQGGIGPWLRGDTNSWQSFVVDIKARMEVPAGFPLRTGKDYFGQGQLLLMDHDRWAPGRK